ncbi:hypothetical protein B4135_3268 [Caldibacillus debilis]|uniref:Uncharacterized protein n=1 Tax=Caldibacillus debilis TaxID=301148 RepID=A0A150LFL8_9BACI|nr:hypothetical protein B4135_3268 [Caldibacillus debilis]
MKPSRFEGWAFSHRLTFRLFKLSHSDENFVQIFPCGIRKRIKIIGS